MDYLIKIKKGGFWQRERVSSIFLFNRLCELIKEKKDIEVYTIAGQKEYLSLRYKDGILKIENLENKNVREFKETKNGKTNRKVWGV